MTASSSGYWELIHAERARVLDMVDGLTAAQWRTRSLCTEWTVEQVIAHLTAAANTGIWAWLRSITFAGFDADRHNARRLAQYLGTTPAETLERFRTSVTLTIAPTRDYPAWLGEVIVHGQDIARPLHVDLTPDPKAVVDVARFFTARNFAVKSRTLASGLSLEADDATFTAGTGPLVRGHLLDLVMAIAGRPDYCARLEGDGLTELRRRLARTAPPITGVG